MIGNTIIFKDFNLNEVKARVIDKVMVAEDMMENYKKEAYGEQSHYVGVTKYLCIGVKDNIIHLVIPNSVKKVD